MIKDGTRAKQVRRRQLAIAGAAAAVVMVVAAGAALFVNNNTGQKPGGPVASTPLETKAITTGGAAYDERGAWRTQVTAEVQKLSKQLDEYKSKDAEAARSAKAADDIKKLSSTAPPVPPPSAASGADPNVLASVFAPPTPPLPKPPKNGVSTSPAGFPIFSPPNGAVPPPSGGDSAAPMPKSQIGSVKFDDVSDAKPGSGVGGTAGALTQTSVGSSQLGGGSVSGGGDGEGSINMNAGKQAGSYIPAGTFARMVVLNGLDAPTGGQSQANPSPVLLKIIDSASLPNGFRANLAGCIVTANGYGDVSAERAYIRIDRLTCVSETGGAVDIAVKGYVAGEDGKAGMRGRLVTKTGQILANALLSGIGSGIGQAFSASATTTSTNPFGGVSQTVNPGQELQAGLSSGVGKAFDTLAKYYVTLAEKTFPIIEIDGARVADVVFSRGFTLEGR